MVVVVGVCSQADIVGGRVPLEASSLPAPGSACLLLLVPSTGPIGRALRFNARRRVTLKLLVMELEEGQVKLRDGNAVQEEETGKKERSAEGESFLTACVLLHHWSGRQEQRSTTAASRGVRLLSLMALSFLEYC